jgi:DNA (cytosine-5)-methyltransferase 1
MNFGSVCSGIEAASVAWHPLGFRAAWLAEIEAFPAAVLAHHYPEVPNLSDMTQIATEVLTGAVDAPDVLVGGTPCQAFSVAGMRAGLQDARGKLTIEFVRLADAIDHVRTARGEQPSIAVWENVPGVLSDRGNAFGCFLGALAGEDCELQPSGKRWTDAGCVYGPKRAIAWRVLDAQYFGLAQRRRRVFVVASAREGFDPASVLFEREGVRRDTPPRRGEGQDTAGTLASGTGAGGFPGTDEACSGYVQPVSGCLNAAMGKGKNGQDVGSLVAFSCKDHGADAGYIAPTLRAMGHSGSHANAGGQVAVCVTGDIAHTLKAEGFDASEDGTGRGQPIISVALRGREGGATAELGDDVAGTLRACSGGGDKPHALVASAVRRLTPTECERLQGFPDGYTLVPYRNKEAADGPRYKALGNSMAVPVMRFIGQRIADVLNAQMEKVA